jgi:hypothetical protein
VVDLQIVPRAGRPLSTELSVFSVMERGHAGASNSREKKKREQGSRFLNKVLLLYARC